MTRPRHGFKAANTASEACAREPDVAGKTSGIFDCL